MMSEPNKIAFIGYSGHAYVCIETAQQMGYEIIGYYDVKKVEENPYDLSFLGNEEGFENNEGFLFGSIGDNKIRQHIYDKISKIKKGVFTSLIHPTAIISNTVVIEDNTLVSAAAIVNALSVIETGCIINTGAIIEHECHIKAFVHIAPRAVLAGNVTVRKRSFIGVGAVVKQGITIGKDVIVGAGAVVVKDIPDNQVVVGNPAKQLRK
ncbi:NeuD/PglB/VioB family sugar acetyltransferase [Aequorivita sinensis]|uniref:NeuD/PglB/VioB family sugar acetyltransferase n=1 Tax=Aequorivita sinensis TaxID=1382458 RepID=UPI001C55477B|nr:NeuD/PglB/VioB family sugar acetyltransferase [Aequorivita sinensis]